MKTIWLFKGISRYDVLRHFTSCLSNALIDIGYQTREIDLCTTNKDQILQFLESDLPVLAIGYNCVGLGLISDDIPYMGINVDHPFFHHLRLNKKKRAMITSVDRSHIDFLKKYYSSHISTFLPHAGCFAENRQTVSRDISILFAGSYRSLKDRKLLFQGLPTPLVWYFNQVIDAYLNHEIKDLKESYMQVCDTYVDLPLLSYLNDIEEYIRNYRRIEVLQVLANHGVVVDIYGHGWENSPFQNRHRIHPQVPFTTLLQLMQQSKIVLNIMVSFPEGGHERVFSGMLNQAMVMTDSNIYYKETFNIAKEIETYSFDQLEHLPEMIKRYLSAPVIREEISYNGYIEASKKHTFKERAKELMSFCVNNYEKWKQS